MKFEEIYHKFFIFRKILNYDRRNDIYFFPKKYKKFYFKIAKNLNKFPSKQLKGIFISNLIKYKGDLDFSYFSPDNEIVWMNEYKKYLQRKIHLKENFKNDLLLIKISKLSINESIKLFLNGMINIETIIILDKLFNILERIKNSLIYEYYFLKNYSKIIEIKKNDFKKIYMEVINE